MYTIPVLGVIGEDFRMQDLLMHLNAAKDSDELKLVIGSPGGYFDEGVEMVNLLKKTNKKIYTSNSGDVASMAVSFFLLPENKEDRTFDSTKGQFLIHNPWGDFRGDAADMELASKSLKKAENKLRRDYSVITGSDENVIGEYMNINEPLSDDVIDSLGFATIKKTEFKAVAKINFNNKMSNEKDFNEKMSLLESMIDKVKGMFEGKAKALVLQDANGVEIVFPDVKEGETLEIGAKAQIEGKAAEGDIIIGSGETLKFEGGKLIEKVPAEDEVVALKREIDDLKAKLSTSETEKEALVNAKAELEVSSKAELEKLEAEISGIKAMVNSEDFKIEKKTGEPTESAEPKVRRGYKRN